MSGVSNVSTIIRSVGTAPPSKSTVVSVNAEIVRKMGDYDSRRNPDSSKIRLTNESYVARYVDRTIITLHDFNESPKGHIANTASDYIEIEKTIKSKVQGKEKITFSTANDDQKKRAADGLCFIVNEMNHQEVLAHAGTDPFIAALRWQVLGTIENLASEHNLDAVNNCLLEPVDSAISFSKDTGIVPKVSPKPVVIISDGKGGFVGTNL